MMNLLRRTLPMALPILFLLSSPIPSTATSVVMLSDTELIVSSRFILTGEVRSVISAWDTEHSAAWTYVEVRVDRVLKGELAARTVVIKQIGGGDTESGMRVFGQPTFSPDQRVLLYLNTARDGTLHVAHTFMGMFSIIEDAATGHQSVTRWIDPSEVQVLSRHDGETVTDRSPIESYIRRLRRTLRRETARIAEIDASRAGDPVVAVPPEYSRKKKAAPGYTADFALLGGGVRWPQADAGSPINYYVNPDQSPVAGGGTAEITRAMDAWPNQSGAGIRLQLAGQTGGCGFAMDGVNTISFGDCQHVLDPPTGCSGILAQTSVIWTNESSVANGRSFHRLIEADIVFNDGMNCILGNPTNLAETACHELGHSIGLAHSADSSAIMWPSVRGGGRGATLGSDDKQGVLSIYPASGTPGGGGVPAPLSITTTNLAAGVVNLVYREVLSATGGAPPYRWSLIGGALPPGLFLSSAGVIDGVPTRAGFFSIIVLVTGSSTGSDSRQLSLTIRDGGSPPVVPTITRVKMKKKKLWVFGEGFRADSLILLNGVELTPRSFTQEETTGTLYYKGKLSRQPDGANVLYVKTGNYWSTAYVF